MGVVGFVARQDGPHLPGVLVGDGDQHFAEGHSGTQMGDPALLGRGLFVRHGAGAQPTAARTLDQQRSQVAVAATGDGTEPVLAAAGVLAGD